MAGGDQNRLLIPKVVTNGGERSFDPATDMSDLCDAILRRF